MPEFGVYVAYDEKRDRFVLDFHAVSDEEAKREFVSWYRIMTRPSRWETRKLYRYHLFKLGTAYRKDAEFLFKRPVHLMSDADVTLSWDVFVMSDPPATPEEAIACRAEFERVKALDDARIARKGNQ